MNNSSANNILLKSVQAPVAQASVAKRNYQDDQADSFQQRLQDAHESTRAQTDRASKPTPKKSTVVDNAKSNIHAEKGRAVSVQESHEKRAPEKVNAADKNLGEKDEIAEQDSNPEVNGAAGSEASVSTKDTVKKSPAKNAQGDEQDGDTTDPVIAQTPTALKETLVPSAFVPVAEGVTNGQSIVESDFTASSASTASKSVEGEAISAATSSTGSALPLATESSSQPIINDADKLTDVAITPIQEAAARDLPATPLQQVPTATPADELVDQSIAAAAAGEIPELPKAPVTPSTSSGVTDEDVPVSDDVISASSFSSNAEANLSKASPKITSEAAQTTEPNQKQNVLLDPKASFEKALQNVSVSESGARDQGAPSTPAQSNPTTGGSALDSMFRFAEANTPSSRGFVVQTAVPVPVGQPQWSQAVGEKVLWLAAQNVSSAEINLNPEHLGPVQVKVSVNQEQTSVSFTSHHAVVREVLDQNLGRLRDMFSEQGLNLVNVDVSDKSFSRQQGDSQHQGGQGAHQESSVEEEAPVAVSLIKQQRLVDHYA